MKDGITVMSTVSDGPLTFKVGHFSLVNGFNRAVLGMKVGERKNVIISAKDAFGAFDEKLISRVSLSLLPEYIRVGQRILAKDETYYNVLEVNNEEGIAILDANHFLAGKDLSFSIRILGAKISPSSSRIGKPKRNFLRNLENRFLGMPKFA